MAITLVGSRSGGNNNGGDVSITLPGGTAEDDIVLVMGGNAASGGDAGVNTSGYNEVIDRVNGNAALSVSWKRMGGSPDGSVSCKGSSNSNDATAYVVYVFRGVSTLSAIDETSTSDEANNSDPNSPSITTATAGAAVVSCFAHAVDEPSYSAPSGYGDKVITNRTETNPLTVGAAWDAVSGAGTENPGAFNGGTSGRWVAATIALRPAVVGTVQDAVFSASGSGTFTARNGTLSVLRATGTGTATLKGNALKPQPFSMTGTLTPNFVGTGASPNPSPFVMTGTGTASFIGALAGGGALSATGTANVSFVGDFPVDAVFGSGMSAEAVFIGAQDRQKHVREVVESRGKATVTMRV